MTLCAGNGSYQSIGPCPATATASASVVRSIRGPPNSDDGCLSSNLTNQGAVASGTHRWRPLRGDDEGFGLFARGAYVGEVIAAGERKMSCRVVISFLTALLTATTVPADTFVYVSVAAEKRIAVYRLNTETGKLMHRSDCKVADGEPGALTVDPDKRFLLAAIRSTGKLASFRIDRTTGRLTHVNTVPAGPDPAQI